MTPEQMAWTPRVWWKRRRREREALVRIAGTPTKNSSEEAKAMARAAMEALSK